MQAPVLLLKTPSDILEEDAHYVELTARGYRPVFVPVLETAFTNQDDLRQIISTGPRNKFCGVTVTSRRAADAWKEAALSLGHIPSDAADWSQTPFYAVGQTTAHSLASISESAPRHLSPTPGLVLGADEAGTSESLAHFIVARHQKSNDRLALLELIGDKNKDTLRQILHEAGISSQRLQLYATTESTTFGHDLDKAISDLAAGGSWWIVFFAPSAAESALPHLRRHFQLPSQTQVSLGASATRPSRLAAIGPTTAKALRDRLGLDVAVVPPKPEALHLAEALLALDSQTVLT